MKNILILSGSPRKGGNSDTLCDEFLRGAEEAGHRVEKIRIAEKKVAYCQACYGCKDSGICVIKDDMAEIMQKIIDADVLVLATPVYFYSVSAQLKAVIDRTVARWEDVHDKEMYYIMTAAEAEDTTTASTLASLRGYAECVEGAKEMGIIHGIGLYQKGEVENSPYMEQAYQMGRSVR